MVTIERIEYGTYCTLHMDTGEKLILPIEPQYTRLSAGDTLDTAAYLDLKELSNTILCRRQAFSYLSRQSRSRMELSRYLKRKGYDEDIQKKVLRDMEEEGYINDRSYAREFLTSRLRRKSLGPARLHRELSQRGIDRAIIEKTLKEHRQDLPDREVIYALAVKKFNSVRDRKDPLRKTAAWLQSQGFETPDIVSVLHRLKTEMSDTAEDDSAEFFD